MKRSARSWDYEKMAEYQGDEIVIELNSFELSTEKVNKDGEN